MVEVRWIALLQKLAKCAKKMKFGVLTGYNSVVDAEEKLRILKALVRLGVHELRTSLNAISGWSKLLSSGRLQEADRTRGLSAVERSAKLQSGLLQELMELTQSLEEDFPLQREVILIPQLLDEIRTLIEFQTGNVSQVSVYADKEKLRHALGNLISYCVGSSTSGPIRIDVSEFNGAQISIRSGSVDLRSQGAFVSLQQPDLFSSTRLGLLYATSALGWCGAEMQIQEEEDGVFCVLIIFSSASISTGLTR